MWQLLCVRIRAADSTQDEKEEKETAAFVATSMGLAFQDASPIFANQLAAIGPRRAIGCRAMVKAESFGCDRMRLFGRDFLGASAVPVDNVDQLPGVFAELELQLSLFVDDQLSSRIENAGTLVLV
jgi:hypothetical protein